MNIEILARILILVCAGIAVLCILIGILIFQINRKKGLAGIALAVVFTAITGYYAYLFFFPVCNHKIKQEIPSQQPAVLPGKIPVMLTLETEDGSQLTVEDGDYLEIKSDVRIKITGATRNNLPIENIRINVVGFTPSNNPSTTDDTGYTFSYKNMQKRFAIDEEKSVYRVEVKKNDEKLAEIFLKFIK